MKRISEFLTTIDRAVDQKVDHFWSAFSKYMPIFAVVLISSLVITASWRTLHKRSDFITAIVGNDLTRIAYALKKIDSACTILSFDGDRIPVTFLNNTSFVELAGCLNVARPQSWHGPYLSDIPTVQGKSYEIVRAYDGYFLVPGQGVQLPHGLIMGTDIVVTPEVPLLPLLEKGEGLNHQGEPLAKKLEFEMGDWSGSTGSPIEYVPRPAHARRAKAEAHGPAYPSTSLPPSPTGFGGHGRVPVHHSFSDGGSGGEPSEQAKAGPSTEALAKVEAMSDKPKPLHATQGLLSSFKIHLPKKIS